MVCYDKLHGIILPSNNLQGQAVAKNSLQGTLATAFSSTVSVVQVQNKYNFPAIGQPNVAYIASEENAMYRWDDDRLLYFCVGRDYEEIGVINGNI